jgi:hypothetical protein
MTGSGHSRRFDGRPANSDLPLSTDMPRVRRHVSKVPSADLALFTAGNEMPIWADILSCNGFEPEGSFVCSVLHSIVCACLARRSEGESPALAAIEAAISRANIDRAELAPFLWTSSASQEVVNDIVLIQNQTNGRPCHRHGRLRTTLNRRQIVTRLRVVSPCDCAQKRGIRK